MCVGLLFLSPIPASAQTAPAGAPPDDPLNAECEVEKDAQSCAAMAIKDNEGRDVEPSPERIRNFSARACEGGEMMGYNLLGALLEDGRGGPKDSEAAAEVYRKACANEYDGACYNRGTLLYRKEARSTSDFIEARKMFAVGCKANRPQSCNDLAVMLKHVEGGDRDLPEARSLFTRACDATVAIRLA